MNKGFKALPEYVQRKIDPEMAKKFNEGGIVGQLSPQVNVTEQKDIMDDLFHNPIMSLPKVNSNSSPIFQRFGNDLSNAITQKVPNFVQKVQGQAEQEFGRDAFQNSGGISVMPQYRNELTSGLGQRIGGLSQINNLSNVLGRKMFQNQPTQMAMGGEAMMSMPEQPPTAPPDQVQFMEDMSRQQGAQLADQMMADIDAADDPKSMIDAFRGNEKPLEARYAELAGYVGEADAQQTPESVLAMVQPTIMLTEEGAIDSGIGELMQGLAGQIEMETPSGEATPMGQGVGELMAMGAGNTPPVNFNQGGEVRHFAPGGAVTERATTMLPQFRELYASVLGDPAAREAELEEQKKLTRAQMLFDIAQTALAAGAPTAQPMSAAERLMSAAQGTQLFNRIGDRAAGQLAAKQALEKEKRQMDLAALQSSISQAAADKAAADALDLAAAKKNEETIKNIPASIFNKFSAEDQKRIIFGEPNSVNGIPRDLFDGLSEKDKKLILGTSTEATEVKGIPMEIFNKLSKEDQKRIIVGDPLGVNGIPRDIFDGLDTVAKAQVLGTAKLPVKGVPFEIFETLSPDEKTRLIVGDPQGVNGVPRDIFDKLDADAKKSVLGTRPEDVKGVPRDIYDKLSSTAQDALLGIDVNIKGVPESIFKSLSQDDQKKLIGVLPVVADQKEIIEKPNAEGGIDFELINKTTGEKQSLGSSADIPDFIVVDGSLVQTRGTTSNKPEIVLDKQGLDSMFGGGDLGMAATYVSNENLLKKYADGTLNKETDGISDSEMNTAFEIYTSPVATSYNEATKTYATKPGQDLTTEMIEALNNRKAKGLSIPRKIVLPGTQELDTGVEFGDGFDVDSDTLQLSPTRESELNELLLSPYALDLNEEAFGSDAFFKKLANITVEAGSFGFAGAPFKDTKSAIKATENLNQEFMSFFMAAQDIRDSVFQAEKLENLTPKPAKFWGDGDDDAAAAALVLYQRLDRAIKITEYAINQEEIFLKSTGTGSVSEKRQRLPQLHAMKHGYGLLANIFAASTDKPNSQQQLLINELEADLKSAAEEANK